MTAITHTPYADDLRGDWMLYLDGEIDEDQMERTISYVAVHVADLRERLAAQVDDQDGRYVVLCDDGSIIATDEFMVGDDVLLDRGAENGSQGDPK